MAKELILIGRIVFAPPIHQQEPDYQCMEREILLWGSMRDKCNAPQWEIEMRDSQEEDGGVEIQYCVFGDGDR